MSNKNIRNFLSGKGYYIALILCALALGITGYVSSDRDQPEVKVEKLDTPVLATQPPRPVRETTSVIVTTPAEKTVPRETSAPKPAAIKTCAPVEGEILSDYAMECLGYNQTTRDWRVHNGVDYGAPAGTAVCAAADGEVYTVYEDDQMGTTIVIRHDQGYTTKYASLAEEVAVSAGEKVTMGQTIGSVGATALMEQSLGEHVHFCVTKNDQTVDPMSFLGE